MGEYRFSENVDQAIVDLVASLLRTLNLVPWTVGLSSDPPDGDDETDSDDIFATIEPTAHRTAATIYVCDDFLALGHNDILNVLVHEVCHLYFRNIRQAIDDQDSLRTMSVGEFNQFRMRTHNDEELAVDAMADAWSGVLIEWDSTKKCLSKITKQVQRSVP